MPAPPLTNAASVALAIVDSIANISSDDLAYLALTGKAELTFRDALAVHLHNSLEQSHVVAREWSGARHDLAVLRDGHPETIFEFKYWAAVDALDTSKLISNDSHHGLLGAFGADQDKIRRTIEARGGGTGFVCTLFFSPDVRGTRGDVAEVIKYRSIFERQMAADGWDLTLSSGVAAFVEKVAGSFGAAVEALGSGSAWGVPVGFAVVVAGI